MYEKHYPWFLCLERITNLILDHANGSYVYDVVKQIPDFTSRIGVTSTGHCHQGGGGDPEQASQLLHGQLNIYYHKPMLELIEALQPIVPPGLDSFYFTNSGAECIEASVKLAKHATGRTNVIVFNGGFHGRTHLTMTMSTSKITLRKHYQPLVAGVFVAPYPYSYYYGMDDEATTDFCLRELKKLFKGQTSPDETACVVIEPVLGEGGYVVPPVRFMQELRQICTDYGILLVADEVQSRFGRTRTCRGHSDRSDVMAVAKDRLRSADFRRDTRSSWLQMDPDLMVVPTANALACAAAVATVSIRDEAW
jgi:4-aminobutyrate aminotransferase